MFWTYSFWSHNFFQILFTFLSANFLSQKNKLPNQNKETEKKRGGGKKTKCFVLTKCWAWGLPWSVVAVASVTPLSETGFIFL